MCQDLAGDDGATMLPAITETSWSSTALIATLARWSYKSAQGGGLRDATSKALSLELLRRLCGLAASDWTLFLSTSGVWQCRFSL